MFPLPAQPRASLRERRPLLLFEVPPQLPELANLKLFALPCFFGECLSTPAWSFPPLGPQSCSPSGLGTQRPLIPDAILALLTWPCMIGGAPLRDLCVDSSVLPGSVSCPASKLPCTYCEPVTKFSRQSWTHITLLTLISFSGGECSLRCLRPLVLWRAVYCWSLLISNWFAFIFCWTISNLYIYFRY